MVKGLSSPNKEDSSSLAFTLACTNDVYGKNDQENFMCNEIHDSANRNTGFKSIFQSLYCRNTNMSDAGTENVDDSIEEPEEVVLADKTSLENLPRSRSACALHASKTDLLGDKTSDILVSNRAKDGVIPSDFSGKQMNSTADRTSVDVTLAVSNELGKTNPLNSLWITRLSTRTQSSEAKDVSPDCQVYASEKEVQMVTANGEASVDLKSLAKLPHILPSPKCRSSEAMASVFARRLQKLLEDLLAKSNSFERFAESPCLCIRCFELDHWAISCPLASSTKHWRSEQNVSVFSHFTACRLQLHDGNENRSSYHKGDEDQKLVAADRTAVCSKKLLLGSFPSNSTLDMKKCSNKRDSASNEIQRSNVSNFINNVKDNNNFLPCNIFTVQSPPVAKSEIFRAVRNLRLSRADILRWMDSDVSLSHLNGFFLRLRLGKLEAGLGGTSYYVACITGDAREHNSCQSKKVHLGRCQWDQIICWESDEIKAWWCRIVKSGCRLPSVEELNSKLNDRKSFGF
ncbi:hypothetical protein Sango_2830000 [Sesamum angolense]|uniref:Plus3 domain-containing protein n=1 Tax=Sesamum angolense TaxID=2727404 RepID=A0AAE1W0N2_9LAMI|nr:hypothetical protein Sango_2830000 [Sesamum angolense]